jgi:hypothetical protein
MPIVAAGDGWVQMIDSLTRTSYVGLIRPPASRSGP